MKKINFLFIISLLFPVLLSMSTKKERVILFFGDSITQMGSDADGFITLLTAETKGDVRFINAGIGGNKVTDLYLRLEESVLDQKPDEVMIWVGINDVWHRDSGTGTDLNKFPGFYQKIIEKMQKQGIKVTLCTPGVIGELKDQANPHDPLLNEFSEVIRKLAAENNTELIDFRKIFLAYEQQHNVENKDKGILTTDRVHLNKTGNRLVADAIKTSFHL